MKYGSLRCCPIRCPVGTEGVRLGFDETTFLESRPLIEDLLRQPRRRYHHVAASIMPTLFPLELQGLVERLIDFDGFVDLGHNGFIKFGLIALDGQQVMAACVDDAMSNFRCRIEGVESHCSASNLEIRQQFRREFQFMTFRRNHQV